MRLTDFEPRVTYTVTPGGNGEELPTAPPVPRLSVDVRSLVRKENTTSTSSPTVSCNRRRQTGLGV